jgi:hypothetical protein
MEAIPAVLIAREPVAVRGLTAQSAARIALIVLLAIAIVIGLADGWFIAEIKPDTAFIGGTIR